MRHVTRRMRGDPRTLSTLVVALVIVTLVGSVVIPAQLTRRVFEQLDQVAVTAPEVRAVVTRARTLEHNSLIVNAGLVLVALAALVSVLALTRRERRLAGVVRQRLAREHALREAAQSLAESLTIEDVTHQIVHSAVQAVATGAYVEHIVPATAGSASRAVVEATAGPDMPAPGTWRDYSSSYAKRAIDRGEPMLVTDLVLPVEGGGPEAGARVVSGIVVPLAHTAAPIGALFLINSRRMGNDSGQLAAAYTFGKLAALAYEKVRLLEEAREGRGQLERAMKSRSRLMRGFSHDVKNPLGAAKGYADLLTLGIHGDLTADQQLTVSHIQRCIETALALIDDLHQLGRVETGHVQLEKSTVDLGSLVRAIGEDYEGAANGKGLSLLIETQPGLPLIETDPVRVREVVGNFLSNAIKYTPTGSVLLRVRSARDAPDNVDGVWIDVIDTGPGIPAEKHALIFEEFSRLGTDQAGAGLGLAISKLLTEALGGRISVVSRSGTGSTFSLWLPAGSRDDVDAVSSREERADATAGIPG